MKQNGRSAMFFCSSAPIRRPTGYGLVAQKLGATSGNIAASRTKLWNQRLTLIAAAIAKGKSPDPVASTDQKAAAG